MVIDVYAQVLNIQWQFDSLSIPSNDLSLSGSREIQKEIGEKCLIYVDPIGAIIISLYIAITWYITGRGMPQLSRTNILKI